MRVFESENVFEKTGIHPEQYDIALEIIQNIKMDESKLLERISKIKPNLTIEILKDIKTNYENAGKELRVFEGNFS